MASSLSATMSQMHLRPALLAPKVTATTAPSPRIAVRAPLSSLSTPFLPRTRLSAPTPRLPTRRPVAVRAAAAVPAAAAAVPAAAAAVPAAAAAVAEDTLWNSAAKAVYSNLLPNNTARALKLAEATVVLCVREAIVTVTVLSLFVLAPRICRLINQAWGAYIMRDDEVTEEEFQDSMFGALVQPMRVLLVVLFATRLASLLLPVLHLSIDPELIAKLRSVGAVLATTWFAIGWKDRVMKMVYAAHPKDKPILINANKFLSLLLKVAGVGMVLEMFGASLKSLVAVGGISGVAIGFASKEIVTNFFGGLVLFITQPFVVGEKIKAGSVVGKVMEIGFLQTRLEAEDNSPIIVPNALFNTAVITNRTRSGCRCIEATFDLRNEDIVRIRPITAELTKFLRSQPDVNLTKGPTMAYLRNLTPTSLQLEVNCALPYGKKEAFLSRQEEILSGCVEIILANGAKLGESAPHDPIATGGMSAARTA